MSRAQRGFDGGITCPRGGVVVVIEEHGLGLKFGRQLHDLVARHAMPDHKTATPGLQGLLQFGHAGVDELDSAVGPVGERIEDVAVENEGAHDLAGALERVVERSVVEVAQIAAEPHQGAGVFSHAAFWSL